MRGQPTSAIALQEAEQSGKLNGKRFEVARAFEQYGPGTSAEVLRMARLDANRNLMRARVTELADLGWLKELPARKCGVTGKKAIVWSFERTEPRKNTGKINATKDELAEMVRRLCSWAEQQSSYSVDETIQTTDVGDRQALAEYITECRAAIGLKG